LGELQRSCSHFVRPTRSSDHDKGIQVRFLVLAAVVAPITEAVSTSETSVSFYETTRRNIPEDSHLKKLVNL
jgi:hypothetical protein